MKSGIYDLERRNGAIMVDMGESSQGGRKADVVFLVEPQSHGRAFLEEILRGGGWELIASDGTDPLPQKDEEVPTLILVSTGHEGLDGIKFIQSVRSNAATEDTPIVVLMDRPDSELSITALKEGADDIAVGPFDRERLLARVEAHLMLARLRQEEGGHVPKVFEQLRLSERRYRSLVSATAAVVMVTGDDGSVTEEMDTWEEFTGQSPDEYRGFGWLSAVHPEDRERVGGLLKDGSVDGKGPVDGEFRLKRKDGEFRQMRLSAIPVRNKKSYLREWVGTVHDVTERKKAEEALREREQRLRLILESSTDFGIFTMDMDGKVTTWNPGAERLLGYADDEICGTDFHRIFIEKDIEAGAPDEEMEKALHTGRGADQRWHRRKDGSLFWADGLVMPLRDDDGTVTGFLKIIRDYTEQKKSEDDLRRLTEELEHRVAERTREVEESRGRLRSLVFELNRAEQMERQRIAAELHDGLAQLLTAGRLSLEAATREIGERAPPTLGKVQAIMSEATRTTRSLMAELSGPPVLEHDDLVATIRWLVDDMREAGLAVEFASNEPHIPLERDLLILIFQSVRELLLNVQKHAGVSGASVGIERLADRVEIEVADEGRGFDSKQGLGRPGKGGGFGLLNINERFRWLGGRVDISAAVGRGTSVRLCLPLKSGNGATAGLSNVEIPTIRGRRQILERDNAIAVLLVDDHRMVREGFRSLIEDKPDIQVVGEAADGVEAVKKAHELRPDVVVMDVNMPRMNGLEATRRIHEEMPEVIIIGLSLHSKDDMAEALSKAGAVAYISKDEACDTLCETIRSATEKRQAERN